KRYLTSVAQRSLDGFQPAHDEPDRLQVVDMTLPSATGRAGTSGRAVIGVECSAMSPGRPDGELVERLRAVLLAEGYRVAVREKRECAEPACTTEAVVDWYHPSEVPARWFSNAICDKHNYRSCARCESIYVMTNTNSVAQAPSVHCEVCGEI